MKVQELLNSIGNKDFNAVESLQVKKYIPVMQKKKIVMDIIAACTDEIENVITVDRFKISIYADMKILDVYTNLEIATDFEDMIEQYDALCEDDVLTKIISLFAKEYNVIYMILEDVLKELLVQNSIDVQVVKVANKITNFIDSIGSNLDNLNINSILPEGADIGELINLVNMLK